MTIVSVHRRKILGGGPTAVSIVIAAGVQCDGTQDWVSTSRVRKLLVVVSS